MRMRRLIGWRMAAGAALLGMGALVAGCGTSAAPTAKAPTQITVGTLYAGSGAFATSSLPEYQGLQFWAQQVNAKGGAFVKAYNKRIKVKIVAYNDQSSATTATTLYTQLITQNKVNLLVADFGSVLTSVAVPIAREHKTVLFDITGTGASFFTPNNKYIVLTSLPTSGVWPESLAGFLLHKGIKRVAILYLTNDFDQSQATTLASRLKAGGVTPVYDHGVPTSTSSYNVLIHAMAQSKPDAVIELGYPNNDIAFLQALASSGQHFNMVFTVFPGQLLSLLQKNVGAKGLAYTYTYPTPPLLAYNKVNYGLSLSQFTKAFQAQTHTGVNFLTIAGYNAGLVIQKTLDTAKSLRQSDLRQAVAGFSGKIFTLDGRFRINSEGAQVGETLPVGQLVPTTKGLQMVVVYPAKVKTGSSVYPAP
ncbi:MAG: ABC transporter substrate-binding protein [Thermaerobacter sp.]|nr:ABC transporter substrate-binding protein [Thermaerobacter sp.]